MAPSELHIVGIDPGATTGWCHMVIPRKCLYGREPNQILDWSTGEMFGPFEQQVIDIARWALEIQSMDYKVGPALIVEDFDVMIQNPTTDSGMLAPVRIASGLKVLSRAKMMGDARIVLQGRTIAKQTMTDERLKSRGFYTRGSDHERDATRHALTALRRAAQSDEFRDELWDRSIVKV